MTTRNEFAPSATHSNRIRCSITALVAGFLAVHLFIGNQYESIDNFTQSGLVKKPRFASAAGKMNSGTAGVMTGWGLLRDSWSVLPVNVGKAAPARSMEPVSEIREWLALVWAGSSKLMTGSLIILSITVIAGVVWPGPTYLVIFLAILTVASIVAGFVAWRDEHRKRAEEAHKQEQCLKQLVDEKQKLTEKIEKRSRYFRLSEIIAKGKRLEMAMKDQSEAVDVLTGICEVEEWLNTSCRFVKEEFPGFISGFQEEALLGSEGDSFQLMLDQLAAQIRSLENLLKSMEI